MSADEGPGPHAHLPPTSSEREDGAGRSRLELGMLVVAGALTSTAAVELQASLDPDFIGRIDPGILLQDAVWPEYDGTSRRLESLTAEERVAITMYLRGSGHRFVAASKVRIAVDVACGMDRQRAEELLAAVDELDEGWIERTPLLRRMGELDSLDVVGDAAQPATRVRTVEVDDESIAELHDDDEGRWRVVTETSQYDVLLDDREVVRFGGAQRGHHISADGIVVWSNAFADDQRRLRLVTLNQCRVGAPMRYEVIAEGVLAIRASTDVQSIRRIRDAGSR